VGYEDSKNKNSGVYYGEPLYSEDIIMQHGCVWCGALPGVICDRSRDRLPAFLKAQVQAEGRSHRERLWSAQGHPEYMHAELRRREWAGRRGLRQPLPVPDARQVEEIAVGTVRCPSHGSPRRTQCPCGGACRARVRSAAAAAVRRARRGRRKDFVPLTRQQRASQERMERRPEQPLPDVPDSIARLLDDF